MVVRMSDERIAVFIDFENLARGAKDAKLERLDVAKILERIVEKGRIVVKRAYADWSQYQSDKRPLHEAGIELVDIPQRKYSGKNSADIKMVVDAMDMCYSKEHLSVFVLASGDSDFAALVAKLKENDKTVVGVGVRNSTSDLLAGNCDEFIFYDDLAKPKKRSSKKLAEVPKAKQAGFKLVLDAIAALKREDKEVIWGSMVKQTVKRKQPSFSESSYGYQSFSEMLEDGQKLKLFRITKDQKSGSYILS